MSIEQYEGFETERMWIRIITIGWLLMLAILALLFMSWPVEGKELFTGIEVQKNHFQEINDIIRACMEVKM